jgi:hypothetical protein
MNNKMTSLNNFASAASHGNPDQYSIVVSSNKAMYFRMEKMTIEEMNEAT